MKFIYTEKELYNYGEQVNCALCKNKHYLIESLKNNFRFKCHKKCSEIVFYYNSNLDQYTMTLWRYRLYSPYNIFIRYFNSCYPNKIYVDFKNLSGESQYTIPYTDFYNLNDDFFRKINNQIAARLLLK